MTEDKFNKRIIDLQNSDTGLLQSADSVIQCAASDQFYKLVEKHLERVNSNFIPRGDDASLCYDRAHNAILIEGSRGSGKTTFLLNSLKTLKDDKKFKTLEVLQVVDPTLIETKEHMLLVLISMIEELLDKKLDFSCAHSSDIDFAREAMAEGLRLLDGIGGNRLYGDEWEDATWVMSQGLRQARKGRQLERKFNRYISESLKILEKEAFVLAFDDVDTNFEHGFSVLETIRKYLTSPQLILIISGDLDLYGRLVRKNIYRNFGGDTIKYDSDLFDQNKEGLKNDVSELQEQYLLKVMPPQNRIVMRSLGNLFLDRNQQEIKIIPRTGCAPTSLRSWMSTEIRSLLHDTRTEIDHPFVPLIASQPMRLVIGYLRALALETPLAARFAIYQVFQGRLARHGISVDILASDYFDRVLSEAFSWFISHDNTPDLLTFGVPFDDDSAIILHCLALAISGGVESNNGHALRVLFGLALPIALMRRQDFSLPNAREAIFRFLWTRASPSMLEFSARIGVICQSSNSRGKTAISSFGSVGLSREGLATPDALNKIYQPNPPIGATLGIVELREHSRTEAATWLHLLVAANLSGRKAQKNVAWFPIDELTNQLRCGKFSSVLSLAVWKRLSERSETFRSLSALSLISVIGELLSGNTLPHLMDYGPLPIMPSIILKEESFQQTSDAKIWDQLDEEESSEQDKKNTEENKVDESKNDESFQLFENKLSEWHKLSQMKASAMVISPSKLGAIALRIVDDLIALDEEITRNYSTGQIFHRQIMVVLHAILVETSTLNFKRETPKTTDRPFVEALQQAVGETGGLHELAAIIISCPLIWLFLNPKGSYKTNDKTTIQLVEICQAQLKKYWEETKISGESSKFNVSWLAASPVYVAIGSANAKFPTRIATRGFYDVLNVVPGYSAG